MVMVIAKNCTSMECGDWKNSSGYTEDEKIDASRNKEGEKEKKQ